ncbi:adenosylcobinamide-GDP ribazoletransferase [Mesobacillus selenatarsenatis]|uniref:Adenosylcobinamide-GDP ribazoletransferase n=1 Tax=Mesobacillus selenatarsenatis (strain DSM 18680 / JCM 14380 / FERM P-15431 / SF-1) TaxID=1321606 RepID=A0A0A8WYY0_MESS1|nr:adenosylcobinamide-GDP ribazoletransferase [Mesobacillus selenatarsenatis]GAM12204.1 cobalamin synthase [Mesobacillus selenatarsenatis SF-1]
MSWFKGILINLQFFTTIPIPLELPMDKKHLEKAIQTFPLLGLLQGGIYAGLLYAIVEWTPFSSLAAAFALWLAAILVTGGIHLDGWIDSSDAFFSYGDKDKRLDIMKDPRTGAFGVISVIILLSAKFFFIYEIILMLQSATYLLAIAIPFLSRMLMGLLLLVVRPARKEGLGALFKNASTKSTLWIYPVYLLFFAGVSFVSDLYIGFASYILASFLIFLFLRKKIIEWFGGMTGDTLGASVEFTEVLLWMTLWLLHYFAMG